MLPTSLQRHVVWHIRVSEGGTYLSPKVERTFRFPNNDVKGALTCYRKAWEAGFTVTVHKAFKEGAR